MSATSRATWVARLALGAGGLVVIVAGLSTFVGVPLAALVSTVIFLALVVVVDDGVLVPLSLAGGAVARRLPRGFTAPLVVAAVLVGTLSVVALPVLVGINESPDNTTVVNRPYRTTWIVLLAVTALAVVVVGAVRSARARREATAAGAGAAGDHGAGRERAGSAADARRGGSSTVLGAVSAAAVVAGALRSGRSRRG